MAGRLIAIERKALQEIIQAATGPLRDEIQALRAEVRKLTTERDPLTADLREIGIAAAHGDKKAAKRFGELARQMKADGKSAAEILRQAG